MGKGDKLKLLADSYEQPQAADKPSERRLVAITQGQVFEAVSDAEYDRLVEIGAALDPKKAVEKARAEAEAEAERLRAQAAALEAEAESALAGDDDGGDADLDALTVDELRDRAKAAGLEGYSDLRKSDLVDAVRAVESAEE